MQDEVNVYILIRPLDEGGTLLSAEQIEQRVGYFQELFHLGLYNFKVIDRHRC